MRFETVEPLTVGHGRFDYAVECASFAFRAGRFLARARSRFDVVHVVGTAAVTADLVTVPAVRPAEIRHYFDAIEPQARIRRRLTGILRPQTSVVVAIERRLFRPPFPYCLAEAPAVAEDLQEYYDVPADAIEVVPPALDTSVFRYDESARASVRSELGVPPERFVVLFIGDDFERKGLRRAIAAMSRVESDAELWMAGSGPADDYGRFAESLALRHSIRFLGHLPKTDVARFCSACDAVLLPSSLDAWGQPAIEGMATGRVVIVSEFAGAHEAIRDGVNGFVLEGSGSPEQIAKVLDVAAATRDA